MKKCLRICAVIVLVLCVAAMTACSPALSDEDIELWLQQGAQLTQDGDYKAAAEQFLKICAGAPDNAQAFRGLISCYTMLKAADGTDLTEQLLAAYEGLYLTRQASAPELYELAQLYRSSLETVKYRDMLEQSLRLEYSQQTLQEINGIVVDAALENEAVRTQLDTLLVALRADDTVLVATLLLSDAWFDTMLPRVQNGHRRYVSSDAQTGETLKLEVGTGSATGRYCKLWFCKNSSTVLYMHTAPTLLRVLHTGLENGSYNGAFTAHMCSADTRELCVDEGTFSSNVLTGSISTRIGTAAADSSLAEMLGGMSAQALTEYTGSFDNQGRSAAQQLSYVTAKGGVVYAYNADKTKYLYVYDLPDGQTADYVFTAQSLSLKLYPEW